MNKNIIQNTFLKTLVHFCNLHKIDYTKKFKEYEINISTLTPYEYIQLEDFESILKWLQEDKKINLFTLGEIFNLSNLGPMGFFLLNHKENTKGLEKFLELSDTLIEPVSFEAEQKGELVHLSIFNPTQSSFICTLEFLAGALFHTLETITLAKIDLKRILLPKDYSIRSIIQAESIYSQQRVTLEFVGESLDSPNFFHDESINKFLISHIKLKTYKQVAESKS